MIIFSTVHPTDEPINDDDDEMDDRPFTLNNGDELSDDEQLDDNEHESTRNQHIHENYKVDNERGMNTIFCKIFHFHLFRNETNQMGT